MVQPLLLDAPMLIRRRYPSTVPVPRLVLLIVAIVAALAAFMCPPKDAAADTFHCDKVEGDFDKGWDGIKRVPHGFGDGRAVLMERCRSWAGHAYWYQRVNVSVWRNGEKLVEQTLFNGVTSDEGLDYTLKEEVGRVELWYGCGEAKDRSGGKTCSRAWNWSSIYDRMVEVSIEKDDRESEQYYLRRFETSLARADFDEAAGAVRRIASATGAENADWHMRLNERFLTEVARRAKAALEDDDRARARELAEHGFRHELPKEFKPAGLSATQVWKLPVYKRKRRADSVEFDETGEFIVSRTETVAEQIDTLADVLDETSRSELAAKLNAKCVATFPHRLASRLQFADILWGLGRKPEAQLHYREYLSRTKKRGRERFPDRAEKRAHAD